MRAVFPELSKADSVKVDEFLTVLWQQGRNGLYHSSQTRGGVGLGQPGSGVARAFDAGRKQLVIDPHVLPKAPKSHLADYCQRLLDPLNVDLRQSFEEMFNKENGL